MSTPGKHGHRRLGSQYDPDPEGPIHTAHLVYLQALAEHAPDVLRELRGLVDDEDQLRAWAARWHLTDAWCLAYGRATRRLWHDFPGVTTCWAARDDLVGFWVPEPAPIVPRPLKMPHHFDWLVRFQLGETWHAIARSDTHSGRDAVTVRDAAVALARLIGLTLRPTRRGRRPVR